MDADISRTLLVLNVNVPVVALEDFEVQMPGRAGKMVLRKGLRLELPFREAIPLFKKGLMSVDLQNLYSAKELNKIRWVEGRDPRAPYGIDEFFYFKTALLLAALRQTKEADERQVEVYESIVLDIIKLRLQKILRSITAGQGPDRELMSKLSWEERILYTKICHLVNEWYRSMLRLLEGGDIIGVSED